MKLNKKKLNKILSQIKAYSNFVILMDNSEYPGLIDFVFHPKSKNFEYCCLNRLTCSIGRENGLFLESDVETLGKPIAINIARLRDALKGSEPEPELKDGMVNGINIRVNSAEANATSLEKYIDEYLVKIKYFDFLSGVKFSMQKVDYELVASIMPQFVSKDLTRYFMCGYNVDLTKGEDYINFVATDGRKMAICKFPCKHPKMGGDEGNDGNFIISPLSLFVPESVYSQSKWYLNSHISLIRIQTEDYSIDCWARPFEGTFPNYLRVISDKDQNKEWISLNAQSARIAFDSVKGLINNKGYSSIYNRISIDAENPKSIKLSISEASVNIEGESSRPMFLRASWNHLNPCFFNTPFTKFFLKNVKKGVFSEETRAAQGTTMSVMKIFMPIVDEGEEKYEDEWGIDKPVADKKD